MARVKRVKNQTGLLDLALTSEVLLLSADAQVDASNFHGLASQDEFTWPTLNHAANKEEDRIYLAVPQLATHLGRNAQFLCFLTRFPFHYTSNPMLNSNSS